jgi:hypothetical protein
MMLLVSLIIRYGGGHVFVFRPAYYETHQNRLYSWFPDNQRAGNWFAGGIRNCAPCLHAAREHITKGTRFVHIRNGNPASIMICSEIWMLYTPGYLCNALWNLYMPTP